MAVRGRPGSWLVPILFAPTLVASDLTPDPETRLGACLSAVTPRQDFRDLTRRTGTGVELSLEQPLPGPWSIRSRAFYITFREGPAPASSPAPSLLPPGALRMAVDQMGIGAEVTYRVPRLGGLFFLGGLQGTRFEFKTVAQGPPADPSDLAGPATTLLVKEKTSFKLGWTLGAGWRLGPHLEVLARFNAINLDGTTLGTLEGGLGVRF